MEPKTADRKIEASRKDALKRLRAAVLETDAEKVGNRCGVTSTTIARWLAEINQIPLVKVEFVLREFP